MEIKLGQQVKDVITGFEGCVVGKAVYLTGCTQYCVAPTSLDKEGKRKDGEWIDEQRLEPTSKKIVQLRPAPTTPGRDVAAPSRRR